MFFKHETVKIHGVFLPLAGNLGNSPLLFCNTACPRHLGNVGREIAQNDVEEFEGRFMAKLGPVAS